MADPFYIEWDYYMQGYRLHQQATKAANSEARDMLLAAIRIACEKKRLIPRADGLLSFVCVTAWLNGWIDRPDCDVLLAGVKKNIICMNSLKLLDQTPLASAVGVINSLTAKSSLSETVNAVITYFAAAAFVIDPTDFDNHWSYGTALLYIQNDFKGAYDRYQDARDLAENTEAPWIGRNSIKIDRADRKFFKAPYSKSAKSVPVEIQDAIAMASEAILDASTNTPNDSKWHRWYWTLGWAYYEAGEYSQSLTALRQIKNPHDLVKKNLIASYAALGLFDSAILIASDFLQRNPDYTLVIEDRWPYEDTNRRERWKDDLRKGGLPD